MFCNNCERNNLDTASFCENCGAPLNTYQQNPYQNYQPTPTIKCIKTGQIVTNLILSFFCGQWVCVVLDIVSLVFRSNFENAMRYGDYITAQSKASSIKTMMIIAWILYGITVALYIGIIASGVTFSLSGHNGAKFFNDVPGFSAMI